MSTVGEFKAVFSDKPYPISIEMRPLWRICLIIISICVVSGKKKFLDLDKVNILVWMLIRKERWPEYEEYLLNRTDTIPFVSVDSATFKAVEFSIAKGFISLADGRLMMEESGQELLNILENHHFMTEEMDFLNHIGKKLTVNKIKKLTGRII